MTTTIKDIRESIEATLATELGATYQVLKYKFDVTKNDFKHNKKAYGVRSQFAERNDGGLKFLTLDQIFEVIIIDEFKNIGKNDDKIQEKIDEINDQLLNIGKVLQHTKAGLPNVLFINIESIEEPTILDDNEHIVVMQMNLEVRYREALI